MVNTNELLNIAFAIISNFTQVVELRQDAIPQTTNECEKVVIGSPSSPIEVCLIHKKGVRFNLVDGVVESFQTPGSFAGLQDLNSIDKFTGTPTLSSNEVIALATNTLRRLTKSGDPIANVMPNVRGPSKAENGKPIPFYRITWPCTNLSWTDTTADMEIDAEKKQITYLYLPHPGFHDLLFAQQISNRVYKPEPPLERKRIPIPRDLYPSPSTNEVSQAIKNMLVFCAKLGLDPGTNVDLTAVDWQRSMLYTNELVSRDTPVCQVRFCNGARFESLKGVVFDFVRHDACFSGFYDERPKEEWRKFDGPKTKQWIDLAHDLETTLENKLGIPTKVLSKYEPTLHLGGDDLARCVVNWRKKGQLQSTEDELGKPFAAEFDLSTGQIKWIYFEDIRLLGWKEKNQN